jgi:ASC-1-like (ASCH) protein
MEHVAIMKKSWGLTKKILDGRKKIESRWYKTKRNPWDSIKKGETIYFKDSGEPVSLMAEVDRIVQFSGLTPKKVKEILEKYASAAGIEKNEVSGFFKRFRNSRYCILVFLKNPREIRPFEIDKAGFGIMSAWLTADSVKRLKKPQSLV